jgi:hypothetical protein
MSYKPTDPLTDPAHQSDELRRLNLAQDRSDDAMGPWIVGILAGIAVAMLVYGYTRPISTTASAPTSSTTPTTTGAAPATKVNPLAPTAAPSTPGAFIAHQAPVP